MTKLDPYELGELLPSFVVLIINLILACIDEDALNALRSPDPSQEDAKDVRNDDITPALPLSIKLELPNIKIEDDDTQQNVTSQSGSGTSFVLNTHLYASPVTAGNRVLTGYQPSQALIDAFNSLTQPEQKPPSASLLTGDPRGRPSGGASSIARLPGHRLRAILAPQTAPPASSGYQPSTELEAEINSFLMGAAVSSSSSISGTQPRGTFFCLFETCMCSDDESTLSVVSIKREYEEDVVTSLGMSYCISIPAPFTSN